MYEFKKNLERYWRVNLLGTGPRLMKKEFIGPRSHTGWETLEMETNMWLHSPATWTSVHITLKAGREGEGAKPVRTFRKREEFLPTTEIWTPEIRAPSAVPTPPTLPPAPCNAFSNLNLCGCITECYDIYKRWYVSTTIVFLLCKYIC